MSSHPATRAYVERRAGLVEQVVKVQLHGAGFGVVAGDADVAAERPGPDLPSVTRCWCFPEDAERLLAEVPDQDG